MRAACARSYRTSGCRSILVVARAVQREAIHLLFGEARVRFVHAADR
jgi:hypothetical protein